MKQNNYIAQLMTLRRSIEARIDNEIEDALRGYGDSKRFQESMEYVLENSFAFKDEIANQ